MKIEILESLTYSYLRHIEGCRIVQTNWGTSGNWQITKYDKRVAVDLFNQLKGDKRLIGVFGKNSFEQLLKQAEIDVLGINTEENIVYGIDVAFHFNGLNYGSKVETAESVIKKIFRTILIMLTYFSQYDKICSYFFTPNTTKSVLLEINRLLDIARPYIEEQNIEIDFVTNNDFSVKIVNSLNQATLNHSDTSELYLRAIKLVSLSEKQNRSLEQNSSKVSVKGLSKRTVNGMKIGQFVRTAFRDIYAQNLVRSEEIENLQNLEYSKKVFNMDNQILKYKNQSIVDKYNKKRYFVKPEYFENYYLNSQWFERHWDLLLKWLDKLGYKYRNIENDK